jgi:lipopolysaccharide export system protein LptA
VTLLLYVLLAAVDGGVASRGAMDGGTKTPVDIQCDFGRMEGSKQQLVCTGHVRVKRRTADITCEKLIAYYKNKDVNDMKHFECIGNVEAVDGDRWAASDFADYDNEKEVLVMTGHPRGRQGTSRLVGTKIVFHVDSDEMDVDNVVSVLESQGQDEKRKGKKKKGGATPGVTAAPAPDAGSPEAAAFTNPVDIQCDKGRMEGSKEQLVCVGHVRMRRHNTDMTCERLVAHYVNKDVNEVKRMECIGSVEATDGDRWAKSDFADFDTAKEVLVMTGHPVGRQGTNEMAGSKITFYVDSDLMDVDNVIGVLESKAQDERRKANMKKAQPK